MHHPIHRLAPAVALCLPLLAFAQAGRSDPADPKAAAPALRYSSAFADYKPWQDIKPADWRAANDQLRTAGPAGHASHAPAAVQPSPSAPTGHGGHGGQGAQGTHGSHGGHGHHRPGSKP